jgi:hypothetical protein
MSIIDDIAQLMLREGDINAQRQREIIAAQEEQRQSKHRALKMTLKALATFGPYFIPGAGIVPAIGRFGASMAGNVATNRGIGSDEDRLRETRFF